MIIMNGIGLVLIWVGICICAYWMGRLNERKRIRNKINQIHDKYHGHYIQEDIDDRTGG